MRLKCLTAALASLAMTTGAQAGTTRLGVEFGFPVPARDLGADQLGVDAGFTIRTRANAHLWVGADVLFHYWPASASYKTEVDRYLSQSRYVTIDSDTWAFRIYQATPHLRLQSEVGARATAWIPCGIGLYLLDPNPSNPDWTGRMRRVIYRDAGPGGWQIMPGWNAGVGFDLRRASNMAVGSTSPITTCGTGGAFIPFHRGVHGRHPRDVRPVVRMAPATNRCGASGPEPSTRTAGRRSLAAPPRASVVAR